MKINRHTASYLHAAHGDFPTVPGPAQTNHRVSNMFVVDDCFGS
jgi:hypothetical protein